MEGLRNRRRVKERPNNWEILRDRRTRITIIQHRMIIVMIVFGMLVGYGIGMWIVDRYINKNHKDIDNQ